MALPSAAGTTTPGSRMQWSSKWTLSPVGRRHQVEKLQSTSRESSKQWARAVWERGRYKWTHLSTIRFHIWVPTSSRILMQFEWEGGRGRKKNYNGVRTSFKEKWFAEYYQWASIPTTIWMILVSQNESEHGLNVLMSSIGEEIFLNEAKLSL